MCFFRFLFFLLLFGSVTAQPLQFKPAIHFFSTPHSELNADEITDIQIDKEGYVWIISLSAIYKYNGKLFHKIKTKNTNHKSFLRFYERADGKKFVNDYLGNLFFIEADSIRSYENNHLLRKLKKSFGFTDIQFDSDKKLHIAYDQTGYNIIESDTIRDVLKEKNISFRGLGCIISEETPCFIFKGNFKFPISKRSEIPAVFYLFNDRFQVIDSIYYIKSTISSPVSIVTLPNKNYLFSTSKGSMIEFNKEGIIQEIPYPNIITRLFVDKEENLWISTLDDGLHYYPSSEIKASNKKSLLKNTTAFISTQDYQGGLWIYSDKKGLGYITRLDLKYLFTNNQSTGYAFDLEKKQLFLAKDKEVYRYEDDTENYSSLFQTSHKNNLKDLYYDPYKNQIWLSSLGKVSIFKGGIEREVDPLNNLNDWTPGGQVSFHFNFSEPPYSLVATSKQEYFFYDSTFSFVSDIFLMPPIGVLKIKDSIWVNNNNGIYLETPGKREYLGDKYPLAKSYAKSMLVFNNEKVFSFPHNGVFRFVNKKFKEIKYNQKSLLNCHLVKENDSVLWALSEDGCFSISVNRKGEYKVNGFRYLPKVMIEKIKSNGESIFFTTYKSHLGRIKFNDIRKYPLTRPKLVINKVETIDSVYFQKPEPIVLDYNKKSIGFSFESLDYQNLNLFYRCRLKGYDKKWIMTNTTFIRYISLPAGEYTFQVQSKFGSGEWGESEQVSFQVLSPFWQEAWFIVACILTSMLIAYQIIIYRFRSLNRKQILLVYQLKSEQSALRAQMAPHYIFNVIASLKYLIIEETREKANRFLDLFASSMRNILDQSNANFITLNNEIQFISEYLEMERFRLENSFSFKINKVKIDQTTYIPPFLIQPFIENSIQHGLKVKGKGGFLEVSFELELNLLKVTIEDNGVGREKAKEFRRKKKRDSYGVSLIERRLAIHNKSDKNVTIVDLYDESNKPTGTRVILYIRVMKEVERVTKNKTI